MTPLERAARALRDTYPLDSGEEPLGVDQLIPVARAVLTAIREPSEAMDFARRCCHSSTEIWPAMIDAALAEGGAD